MPEFVIFRKRAAGPASHCRRSRIKTMDDTTPKSWPSGGRIAMRPLAEIDLEAAQRVYDGASSFFRALGLDRAPTDSSRSDFEALPAGFPRQRKHYLGIFLKQTGQLAGIADFLDGYPRAETGWIGLLLLAEEHQGRGLGREAWESLKSWARNDLGASELRLGVEEPNTRALRFWTAAGFSPTGETCIGDFGHKVLVMACSIR